MEHGMSEMLQKVGLQCDNAMLNLSVALHAKTYQIAKIVCLHIVVVFTGDVVKGSKRGYVVNIKSLAVLLLSCATHATGVVVALAGKALLVIPVGAIVLDLAALPILVIGAYERFFMPLGSVFGATKMKATLVGTKLPRLALNGNATPSASGVDCGCGKVWITLPAHMRFAPFIPAILTAKKMFVALDFRGVAFDLLAALRTEHLYLRAFVRVCIFAGLGFLPLRETCVIAELAFSALQTPHWTVNRFPALMTLSPNSVSRWHKRNLLSVSWQTCRRCAAPIGGSNTLSFCSPTNNPQHTFDICNYTRLDRGVQCP